MVNCGTYDICQMLRGMIFSAQNEKNRNNEDLLMIEISLLRRDTHDNSQLR
ncbi:hypothetical protein PHET_02547 [Paragonimus heterotremus]|uniref:Uncharacterized protein n=1 Tax=Paragonimus heterotremus TaxID=100268 RepID=A0A8J4TJF2_9TREM|nr:hypothetical protein PHET_02547 [Paragonimus heterotremus]